MDHGVRGGGNDAWQGIIFPRVNRVFGSCPSATWRPENGPSNKQAPYGLVSPSYVHHRTVSLPCPSNLYKTLRMFCSTSLCLGALVNSFLFQF
ncbi:hypothetical protein SAY86_004557 [Trapa natans]|uniref:Uncharacterized protein n=1 Tax=Trapa natans TaxID=22666 RepID=A0AAN7RIY2_TRANT|nr:hypothetical protein SAY86_004557 [Trapa natans]